MNQFWETCVYIDEVLSKKQISYCIIKSYGGAEEYNDGNVDLLVDHNLLNLHRIAFSDDFDVTLYNRTKYVFYEQNKLMLVSKEKPLTPLHLHSSVGWNNLCCIPAADVIRNAREVHFDGRPVMIASRDDEARIFVLHIVLEQFQVKKWDLTLLTKDDFDQFAAEYGINDDEISIIRDVPPSLVSTRELRPIWKKYHARHRKVSYVTPWNRFLLFGALFKKGRLRA
jgi:hypothetical protein